jgi:hypothetical protein
MLVCRMQGSHPGTEAGYQVELARRTPTDTSRAAPATAVVAGNGKEPRAHGSSSNTCCRVFCRRSLRQALFARSRASNTDGPAQIAGRWSWSVVGGRRHMDGGWLIRYVRPQLSTKCGATPHSTTLAADDDADADARRAQGAGRRAQGAGRRAQGAGRRAQGAGRRAQGAPAAALGGGGGDPGSAPDHISPDLTPRHTCAAAAGASACRYRRRV